MAPPFRTEHVGSLMRPANLLAARSAAGVTSSYSRLTEDVQAVTEKAIAEVVARQIELGIRPITSREYERNIFYSGFFENLQGMEVVEAIPVDQGYRTGFPTLKMLKSLGIPTRDSVVAVDRIKNTDSPCLSEWKSLRSRLSQEQWKDFKLTMPPITHSHMQMAIGTAYRPNAYSSDQEYFKDLAEAYAAEFLVLYNEGLRSIQIDDPCLLFFVTDEFRSGCVADGVDPDELLDQYIWAHNQCLLGKPADLHVGLHLCCGNMTCSTHIMSGSYERIAKKKFTELAYDTYYLQ
ncbi:hypothetical protein PENSUB_6579 [Penicillium subrubescens]|uniref:Cobalamin-independent methionine synthase MetE C-terminal/archaeal domain-containing protein n=2 Tax=Penicillium subrubescens TaxID=1316194 RepID=A0A1Q5U059_9EURO|nr:hypothetical protein PENSUB_6579 [Penicillium subrubescens]